MLSMPKELQSLLMPYVKDTTLFQPNHLLEMKKKLDLLRSQTIAVDVLTRLQDSELHKVLNEGKQAVTDLKNYVIANFPSSDPRNSTPRQLVLRLMKWYISLEKLLRDHSSTTKSDVKRTQSASNLSMSTPLSLSTARPPN